MRNAMFIVAGVAIALAPASLLLAETGAAKNADTVAKAWMPATQAEQKAARGGGKSMGGLFGTIISLQNTYCNNVTINIFFCSKGPAPSPSPS